jgi:hypothetical protein
VFLFTRCRVSFAALSLLVICTKPDHASDIHFILTQECVVCSRMKPY